MPKKNVTKYPIIIIGSGPAGCATALYLARARPYLSNYILVLERHRHPRPKICGGGIMERTDNILQKLGTPIDVPSTAVNYFRIVFENRWIRLPARGAMRVVRRDEFDSAFAEYVRKRGISIREADPAERVEPLRGGIRVVTAGAAYLAKAVVGADGVRGRTARLFHRPGRTPYTALCTITRLEDSEKEAFETGEVVIDFTPLKEGLSGYIWHFPCLCGGGPAMNRGICAVRDGRRGAGRSLSDIFGRRLAACGISLDRDRIKGSFGWAYEPDFTLSRPNLLLAGDTAGLDGLTGEGIGPAIRYGKLAADEIVSAFERNDFSFSGYSQRVQSSELGREMKMSIRIRRLQGPKAIEALMERIRSRVSLGRALRDLMSGSGTLISNRHSFAGHALAALRWKGLKLLRTLLAMDDGS